MLKLEYVFLSVYDSKLAVRAELSNVAGSEPTVSGENFCGEFWLQIVTQEDAVAFYADFSLRIESFG